MRGEDLLSVVFASVSFVLAVSGLVWMITSGDHCAPSIAPMVGGHECSPGASLRLVDGFVYCVCTEGE